MPYSSALACTGAVGVLNHELTQKKSMPVSSRKRTSFSEFSGTSPGKPTTKLAWIGMPSACTCSMPRRTTSIPAGLPMRWSIRSSTDSTPM